jgi:hypothetical protein
MQPIKECMQGILVSKLGADKEEPQSYIEDKTV